MGNPINKFNPARLCVQTATKPEPRNRKTYRRREYLPEVEWSWFTRLAPLPGKAGWVALALYRLAVMRKSTTLVVNARELAAELGIDRKSVSGGLKTLEREEVLRLEKYVRESRPVIAVEPDDMTVFLTAQGEPFSRDHLRLVVVADVGLH
jgi:hypothetical protein